MMAVQDDLTLASDEDRMDDDAGRPDLVQHLVHPLRFDRLVLEQLADRKEPELDGHRQSEAAPTPASRSTALRTNTPAIFFR